MEDSGLAFAKGYLIDGVQFSEQFKEVVGGIKVIVAGAILAIILEP